MGRPTIVMKIGFVWAIVSFLSGCAPIQDLKEDPTIAPENKKIDQLTAKLMDANQANLALKRENGALKTAKVRLMYINRNLKKHKRELMYTNIKLRKIRRELMNTNSRLEKDNLELTMKIDMLKILDYRVEEKRKNYSSE